MRRRGWIVRRALAIGDIVGLSLAFLIVEALYVQTRKPLGDVSPETELLLFIASLPIWVLFAKLQGLYDQDEERANHSTVDDLVGVFHLVTAGVWALFICSWALPETNTISAPKLVLFWGFAIGLVTLCRTAARALSRHRIDYFQNTVIVGGGEVGQLVARKLMAHPEYGLNLVGFVDANPREHRQDIGPLRVLGAPDRLPELVVRLDIERVIFAFSQEETTDTLGADPRAQAVRPADRHRAPRVRGRRPARRDPHRRGHPAGRPAADAAVAQLARGEARDGSGRSVR